MPKRQRIGDLLVAKGVVGRADAETVAVEAVLADTRFASVLVDKGRADEAAVLETLSEQLGVPAVDLSRTVVAGEVVDKVPATVARRHIMLPLKVDGRSLLLAMADPADDKVIDEVAFATGLTVMPHVGLHQRLVAAIAKAYSGSGEGYRGDAADAASEGTVAVVTAAGVEPAAEITTDAEDAIDALGDEPLDLTGAVVETVDETPELEAAVVEAAPQPESAAPEEQRVILVVDDELDIQKLVTSALTPLGHRIVCATRGLEALKLIKSETPHLIVLDAMLPEVHGFEICRKVKESKRFRDTPVLMISAIYRGWRIAADIQSLYGVDFFLEKPFRVAELRRNAEKLLEAAPHNIGEENLTEQAQRHYDAGVEAYKKKDFPNAFAQLREAEELEPFSAKVQFMIGRVLEQQDRAFQAIYHYERAIELNPSLFPATKNLALLYQDRGFKHKAVEMWERSLRAAPSAEVREQIKKHLVSIL